MASAKTYKVTMKVTKAVPQIGAVYGGSPFGTCTMTGKLILPKSLQVWKCKGGSIHVTAVGTSGASNDAKGTWTLSKGTGKYKGISAREPSPDRSRPASSPTRAPQSSDPSRAPVRGT
jgi:hypothetical protein